MLIDGAARYEATVVLAHGAGAPMDTPFMTAIAEGIAAAGHRCVRFEFPYMARRRKDERKRGPDRMPVLLQSWADTLAEIGDTRGPLVIGGKSMGGRSAAVFAGDQDNAARLAGVICLGYPFHPPGKPENTRLEPLQAATRPTLILQGERDPFGKPDEIAGYSLKAPVSLEWVPDGDHSFVPRRRSGHTEDRNLSYAVRAITAFVESLPHIDPRRSTTTRRL